MSESQRGADLWAREAWQAEAGRWLDGQLNAAGIERTGDVTVFRIRPWAAVLRAPTSQGDVWLKAAGEVTDFEVRIYDVLYNAAPNRILKPIAVDADRGWLVLPDGGQPLRETTNGDALYEALADVAFDYGLLQREVTPHVERLVELGMMDMRPAAMPARFEEAATAVRPWVETKGSSDDRARFEAALRLQETFNGWCNRLASSPGGTSIDHNDLHPGNVLVGDDGRLTIYDWGDSVVAHPFASMLATFTTLRQHSEFAPDAPEILRIRDSYLRAFADLAPHQELVETLDLACRVAKVARALIWSQWVTLFAESAEFRDFLNGPFVCFTSILEESFQGCT